MGARWYSPANGQFTSKDTVNVNPVPDPAAASPFAYAADNPLTGVDPTGHFLPSVAGNWPHYHPRIIHVYRAPPRPAPSCGGWTSWLSPGCFMRHVVGTYHRGASPASPYHRSPHLAQRAAQVHSTGNELRNLAAYRSAAARALGHLRIVSPVVSDLAPWGIHAGGAMNGLQARLARSETRWSSSHFQAKINFLRTAFNRLAPRGPSVLKTPIGTWLQLVLKTPIGARGPLLLKTPIGAPGVLVLKTPAGPRGPLVQKTPIGQQGPQYDASGAPDNVPTEPLPPDRKWGGPPPEHVDPWSLPAITGDPVKPPRTPSWTAPNRLPADATRGQRVAYFITKLFEVWHNYWRHG
jgi:hypothetical protein